MAKSVVVIPTYNEAENIQPLLRAIREIIPSLNIMVVDDASPDGTAALAEEFGGVQVLKRPGKLGMGTAYIEGFSRALGQGYDAIGCMDADFSHDPHSLPALFDGLEDCHVVVGARYVPGGGTKDWGFHRRVLSRTSNTVARLMLRLPLHDVTSGFRSFRREALEAIDLTQLRSEGYAFQVEILYRCVQRGLTIGEVPIIFANRREGASKMGTAEIWGGMVNLLRLRFSK